MQMALVQIWGCVEDFKTGNTCKTYEFNANLGIRTYDSIEDLEKYIRSDGREGARRVIVLNVQTISKYCNPIWITLSREELQKLVEWGSKILEAYDKNEDLEFGAVPMKFLVI